MKKKVIKQQAPIIEYDYFFVRSSKYEDALKEADSLKEQGWTLRKWHYEATTCSFILTMQRPKGYVPDPEPKQDEDKKADK